MAIKKPFIYPQPAFMKIFTRFFGLLLITLLAMSGSSFGQSILNPSDTLVTYNSKTPPTIPVELPRALRIAASNSFTLSWLMIWPSAPLTASRAAS